MTAEPRARHAGMATFEAGALLRLRPLNRHRCTVQSDRRSQTTYLTGCETSSAALTMRARDSLSLIRASTLAIACPTSSANAPRRASASTGNRRSSSSPRTHPTGDRRRGSARRRSRGCRASAALREGAPARLRRTQPARAPASRAHEPARSAERSRPACRLQRSTTERRAVRSISQRSSRGRSVVVHGRRRVRVQMKHDLVSSPVVIERAEGV